MSPDTILKDLVPAIVYSPSAKLLSVKELVPSPNAMLLFPSEMPDSGYIMKS